MGSAFGNGFTALANQLALHLLQTYSATQGLAERRAAKLSPFKLQRAIDYIDEHLREDLTLSNISEALAMSPGHFAHAFRQSTGLPPHRYVLERRIERAKSLLRQTELPITEVAHLIGCASHSHFSVLFHRSTGCSPTPRPAMPRSRSSGSPCPRRCSGRSPRASPRRC